jgi:protoporphyrinogen oxidase
MAREPENQRVAILGGGIAGLSCGYFLKKRNIPFTIYESGGGIGGNCSTFAEGGFRYDSGAHRLHDKDPDATAEMKALLGDRLRKVSAPSHIYHDDKMILFPISATDAFGKLGAALSLKIAVEALAGRALNRDAGENFESSSIKRYGKTLAGLFLLNYSEKLWGIPCSRLSAEASGGRLKGMNLRTVISATLRLRGKTEHIDGDFYYPDGGIGTISDAMADSIGRNNIRLNSRVSGIRAEEDAIAAISVNGLPAEPATGIISTIPCDELVRIMSPKPPPEVLDAAGSLKFRDMIIVALFLDVESVSASATIYFPDFKYPFTRACEPRNRFAGMSPAGKTSLVFEIPCSEGDSTWSENDEEIASIVAESLSATGLARKTDIMGCTVRRVKHAYPVMEIGFEKPLKVVKDYLKRFRNLKIAGRNAEFHYSWMHDMIARGKLIAQEFRTERDSERGET